MTRRATRNRAWRLVRLCRVVQQHAVPDRFAISKRRREPPRFDLAQDRCVGETSGAEHSNLLGGAIMSDGLSLGQASPFPTRDRRRRPHGVDGAATSAEPAARLNDSSRGT